MTKSHCDFCEDYGLYYPSKDDIPTLRAPITKLLERGVKTHKDASARGKSNRRNGRNAERQLVKWLEGIGVEASLVPMSGGLKNSNVLAALGSKDFNEKMRGDIKVTIDGTTYTVESKRNAASNSWYKQAENGIVHIKGFAYLLRQDLFNAFVHGAPVCVTEDKEDKGYKAIHDYFNQDDSDMVVISRPYCHYLFFVKEEVYERIEAGIRN